MSTAITIRDVPDETKDELAARAARSGRSLQEYLRMRLIELATKPDAGELLSRRGLGSLAGHIGRQAASFVGAALQVPRARQPNQQKAKGAISNEFEYQDLGVSGVQNPNRALKIVGAQISLPQVRCKMGMC